MGRDFKLLAGSVFVSALGDWLALAPLALHLEEATGSGIWVAALFIAVWSPSIVLAGIAGLLVDRLETRRLLSVVSLAQAGVALALAFSSSTPAVLVLATLLGVGYALAQPAEFSLVPVVAGESELERANGYVETARYAGFTLGPLLGSLLAAAGGMKIALLVNAAPASRQWRALRFSSVLAGRLGQRRAASRRAPVTESLICFATGCWR